MPTDKPLITAALLCEHVLVEKDGVLSAIRIVDVFSVRSISQQTSAGLETTQARPYVDFWLLLSVKSGELTGAHKMAAKIRFPSGKLRDIGEEWPVFLQGGENGANLVFRVRLIVEEYGVHYVDVYWNQLELTRVPFKLVLGEPLPAAETGAS